MKKASWVHGKHKGEAKTSQPKKPPPIPTLDEHGRFIGPRDVERGFRFFRDHHPRMT